MSTRCWGRAEQAPPRAHLGVAGSLYGVTTNRLFEITVGERRVTTREVAPLLVALPVLGPERALQEDEYFSVSVDALGFDRNGLLWATGDERLYFCSVATGICATQGILPPDAWTIWFADNPEGEEVWSCPRKTGHVFSWCEVGEIGVVRAS